MKVSLSSQNVIQYLQQTGLSSSEDGLSADSDLPHSSSKNLKQVTLPRRKLLVEQHCLDEGTSDEFFNEWLFDQLLQKFPVLKNISAIASLVVYYDEENSILVRNYPSEYENLTSFYQNNLDFPLDLATAIGNNLAALHRATFNRRKYRDFMATAPSGMFRYQYYNPAQGIDAITPEIFGTVPTSALKFYLLYQRYDSLSCAIAELANEWRASCLTHNNLTLDNVLVPSLRSADEYPIKLINWKACGWGDPAYDIGTILGSYLKIWLSDLVVDPTIELEESLELAIAPLEVLQPSMLNLIQTYLNAFPTILKYRPNFIDLTIKFTGLALINQIRDQIENHKYFDNADICGLEFAKTLLTRSTESAIKLFGVGELEILKHDVQCTPPNLQPQANLVPLYYPKPRLRSVN